MNELKPVREIKIRLFVTEMPESIPGVTVQWEDQPGVYQMFIREGSDDQEKEETFIHEMLHIWHDDFHHHERDLVDLETEREKASQYYFEKQRTKHQTAEIRLVHS